MGFSNICMGCMADKGNANACPYCGWDDGSEKIPSSNLPLRTILNNRYLVGKILRQNEYTATYLAYDIVHQKKIIVREFLPGNIVSRSPQNLNLSIRDNRFQKEFNFGLGKFMEEGIALQRIKPQPGIARIQDIFWANGTAYRVIEFVEGTTLNRFLETQGGSISFHQAVKILTPVMTALEQVHANGLLHFDICPENIIVAKNEVGKIVNFSGASFVIAHQQKTLRSFLRAGYSPKEFYQNIRNSGPWSDIYSLAATTYRAITGHTPPDALSRDQNDFMQLPSALGINISRDAEAALKKALSHRPRARYQMMKQFKKSITDAWYTTERKRPTAAIDAFTHVNCPFCGISNEVLKTDLNTGTNNCFACERPIQIVTGTEVATFTPPVQPEVDAPSETEIETTETGTVKIKRREPSERDDFEIIQCSTCSVKSEVLTNDLGMVAVCLHCGTQLYPPLEEPIEPAITDPEVIKSMTADEPVSVSEGETVPESEEIPETAETKTPDATVVASEDEELTQTDEITETVETIPADEAVVTSAEAGLETVEIPDEDIDAEEDKTFFEAEEMADEAEVVSDEEPLEAEEIADEAATLEADEAHFEIEEITDEIAVAETEKEPVEADETVFASEDEILFETDELTGDTVGKIEGEPAAELAEETETTLPEFNEMETEAETEVDLFEPLEAEAEPSTLYEEDEAEADVLEDTPEETSEAIEQSGINIDTLEPPSTTEDFLEPEISPETEDLIEDSIEESPENETAFTTETENFLFPEPVETVDSTDEAPPTEILDTETQPGKEEDLTPLVCPKCNTRNLFTVADILAGGDCRNCDHTFLSEPVLEATEKDTSEVIYEQPESEKPHPRRQRKWQRKRIPPKKRLTLWVSIIAGALLFAGGGYFYLQKQKSGRMQQLYNLYVTSGDSLFVLTMYQNAIAQYESALKYIPNEDYPKKQIEQSKLLIAEAKAVEEEKLLKQAETLAFEKQLARADSLFTLQKYRLAKSLYQNLLTTSPDDTHIQSRLADIARFLAPKPPPKVAQTEPPASISVPALSNLQEMIDQAQDGGTLELAQGVFKLSESLVIKKSIRLKGAGPNHTLIISRAAKNAIVVENTAKLTASGIGIENEGIKGVNILVVKNGSVNLDNCAFKKAAFDATTKTGGSGIVFEGSSGGGVLNSRFSENYVAIKITAAAQPRLHKNELWNNYTGVEISGEARPLLTENRIRANGNNGVMVLGNAQPSLEGNKIQENKANGIFYDTQNYSGKVQKNQVVRNEEFGILLAGASQPIMENNEIKLNNAGGILYKDKSHGIIRNSEVQGNKFWGIRILNNAKPTVQGNTIKGNTGDGVEVLDKAQPTIEGNHITQNGGDGISLLITKDGGHLRNNTCRGNQGYGISILKNARPTLVNNITGGNHEGNIYEEVAAN